MCTIIKLNDDGTFEFPTQVTMGGVPFKNLFEEAKAKLEHARYKPKEEDDFFHLTECQQAVHSQAEEVPEDYQFGEYFTLDEFVELCQQGMFIDYDGIGNYVNAGDGSQPDSDEQVSPSDIIAGKINRNYSHVHWYNR